MKKDPTLIMITHIGFADDHITVITFMIQIEKPDILVAKKMSNILHTTRQLLNYSTIEMGCSINPIKSENIVPSKFADLVDLNFEKDTKNDPKIYAGKDNFKWLGYFLQITEKHELIFDESKIEKHCKMIASFRNQVFQYTSNIHLKWRIWFSFLHLSNCICR